MNVVKHLGALWLAILLVACGGGGGDTGATPFGPGASGGASGAAGTQATADLSLALSVSSVDNSGSKTVVATATAVDASRNTLSGVPVVFSVDNNAVAQISSASTGTDGATTALVSIGSDRANRLVTVTASAGGITRTASFQVTGAMLTATAIPAVSVPGSMGNKVQYRLVDVNSAGMAAQPIVVSAPGLADVSGTTDASGSFEYTYTAPATSGNLDIVASAGGSRVTTTVVLQPAGSGSVPVAVGPVSSKSISANPSVIAVNAVTSTNRSEVRTLFLSSANRPIPNLRVRFSLPDPNSIGGTLSTGNNTVYTDANGVATTAYVPSARSSPTDGVIVRACYAINDFATGVCPAFVETTLTVIAEALSVSIGTDNTIQEGSGGLTYIKKFVVLVVDSSGQAKANVQLSTSIDLTSYIKGYYDGPGKWNRNSPSATNPVPIPGMVGFTGPTCANEDTNRNGVLEAFEDVNGNNVLEPRKSDVAISFFGASTTGSNGTAVLQIEYPKNVATWINYQILISASGVLGSEGRATWTSRLAADAASLKADVAPAFVVSPYGISNSCVDPK